MHGNGKSWSEFELDCAERGTAEPIGLIDLMLGSEKFGGRASTCLNKL